jgi:hypothetical protein
VQQAAADLGVTKLFPDPFGWSPLGRAARRRLRDFVNQQIDIFY